MGKTLKNAGELTSTPALVKSEVSWNPPAGSGPTAEPASGQVSKAATKQGSFTFGVCGFHPLSFQQFLAYGWAGAATARTAKSQMHSIASAN